jgi:hypothetical protein
MSERRRAPSSGSRERRSFPRPPLWLNLLLLIIAAGTFAYARHERDAVKEKTAILFKPSPSNPDERNRIRTELADMDVTQQQLAKELEARMNYLDAIKGEQFYIAIDTAKQKLFLRLGKDVAREAPLTIGEPRTITAKDGRTWTFVPLKGGFNIEGKETDYAWSVPDWLYAMKGEPSPATKVTVPNGMGKYVIHLPNGYVIQSPPPPDSPLQGPKPGSFVIPENDFAAIWPRITSQTRVYVF